MKNKTILVTGDKGMIGSQLVQGLLNNGYSVIGIDRTIDTNKVDNYYHYKCDLGIKEELKEIFNKHKIDRIIHLAALAHTKNENDLSWERYYHVNVECARNIFELAKEIPVLFISTVDVIGFSNGEVVNSNTPLNPVTYYGKSKKMAEEECKKLKNFTIFRFSPVYTKEIKRDIQKRYYLKYPNIAYQIGKGTYYEILSIDKAVLSMTNWCSQEPNNDIKIIKDDELMYTPDYIKSEKEEGRAKIVLYFPRWMINCGYSVIKAITGENKYTYLLNKAVHPLRSSEV